MTTLRGMGHPDMKDYDFELLWNGTAFQQMLVVETTLQIRAEQPGYDEERLTALVQFVESYRENARKAGFVGVSPIALRMVKA